MPTALWRTVCMPILGASLLSAAVGLSSARANASQLLVLAEDVPAGLDIDGPSIAIPTTQEGMVQLLEPLVDYAPKGPNGDGVTVPDFSRPRGRLLESWSYDAPTLTWTFHLRHGVKSCNGDPFTADDVIYTWQRAKSVSGAVPNAWFLLNMSSVAGFSTAVFSKDPAISGPARKLGAEVKKIDDYTVTLKQSQPNPAFAGQSGGPDFPGHLRQSRHAKARDAERPLEPRLRQ
jgi:peptide/nickel transport system substrate-binding protein